MLTHQKKIGSVEIMLPTTRKGLKSKKKLKNLRNLKRNVNPNGNVSGLIDTSSVNTLRTGLLNCLNARSRGLIQSEVRFL